MGLPEEVVQIPVARLKTFPEHPFYVRDDDMMHQLVESIRQVGVLMPIIVRSSDNECYEIISGHRRKHACELLEFDTVPAIIKEVDMNEATIMMVDSNLQREVILPSEKAKAYKMKLDAIKCQGARTDLTSDPRGRKSGVSSREMIAENSPDSSTQIHRYIRLNELIPELLDLVDDRKMAISPAAEVSYLTEDEQKMLLVTMNSEQVYNNRKISFDAECRKMFLDIAHRNGVEIDFEPVYGGVSYLEKQDFIIENQKRRIAENQATLDALTMKISDLEAFVEEVAEDAYEKACEVVSDTVAEQTREEDIEELRKYKKWLTSDERKTPKDKRDFVGRCLDNLENKLRSMAQKVADKVMGALQNPRLKEQKKAEVKEHARKSVRALLEANKRLVEEQKANVTEAPAQKKSRGEELG